MSVLWHVDAQDSFKWASLGTSANLDKKAVDTSL